ncbi:S-4TM family putative pore-forming effector [Micromonospora sp. CPCC 206061]|uniref:S-4TM family putative pore-forming effector n=1 Tax=Micromonospora sp. CPCC 206061 TaxID=3122410 RepID=UPI002FF0279B
MTHPKQSPGLRGIPARPIHERQLDDDMIKLQRAASASHRRGQVTDAVRNAAAIVLAAVGLVVTATGHGRVLTAILGAGWFAVSFFLLRKMMSSTAKQGALLQEQLDTALFQLPWRQAVAGDPVADHDVGRLARKLPVGGERDQRITDGWYDPTTGVHYPYDVLICQGQNLAWDARLRRGYGTWIAAAAIVWTLLGLLVALLVGATIPEALLSFYVPSLAALQLSAEIWIGQNRVADERERLAKIVQAELRDAQPGPVPDSDRARLCEVARDIQDGIFRTRLDVARVPHWLYRLHRNNDEADFGDTAEGHRRRLAG